MPPYAPVLKLASLNGVNGFRLEGVAELDSSGYSVSGAGDVNGDGYADLIIGADQASPGGITEAGSSYVVFGRASGFGAALSLSGLTGSNGFRLDGVSEGDSSGYSVSSAGDVNGDGYGDIIVGAYRASPGDVIVAGSSYVVFGKAAGFGATLNLSSLSGANGFRIDGAATTDFSGISVSDAGDVNGDGYDDVIVGAYSASPVSDNEGSSYVVFGKAAGFDAVVSLVGLNGSNGFRIDGIDISDQSGGSVSSAGDINNDGYDDILIGASQADPGGLDAAGTAYVVFGKASGFTASFALSTVDGSNGFRLQGLSTPGALGAAVSNAGDVNGDGISDLIVGAPSVSAGGSDFAGSSYVVFGRTTGFGADLNLAALDGQNGFRIDGAAVADQSATSVSAAGDVNGDGFGDLIVGARGVDFGSLQNAGAAYVVFGGPSFGASLNVTSLNGANGYRLDGAADFNYAGYSVSAAGDVNRDGLDDVIVGAYGSDQSGQINAGTSYVIFGALPSTSVTRIGSEISQTIRGGVGDDVVSGLDGNDRLIANGGDDTLLGGAGNDSLDGGAGDDTLSGGADNDTLTGGAGRDILQGGSGTDRLDGGTGADNLDGGSGNDTYRIDGTNDVVTELDGNGTDTLEVGYTFSLANLVSVENLTLLGTGDFNASGTATANVLIGNAGKNVLNGLAGVDTMIGGAGNDIYYVDHAGDVTTELAGGGTDLVSSSVSHTLKANIENLNLSGAAAIDGNGNTLANIINGNARNNVLRGYEGSDTLSGGAGNDILTGGTSTDYLNPGSDTVQDILRYAAVAESTGSQRDIVTGMDLNAEDRFDFTAIPTSIDALVNSGVLNLATINADLAAAVNASLAANGAVLFDPSSGNLNVAGHVFLVVDGNGDGSYTANADSVVELVSHTGTLTLDDFI